MQLAERKKLHVALGKGGCLWRMAACLGKRGFGGKKRCDEDCDIDLGAACLRRERPVRGMWVLCVEGGRG